ncbi:hypothetical protein GM708_01835 [Vibrio cholerae]|nr:hypothetical protein [Vibrio cholerae]
MTSATPRYSRSRSGRARALPLLVVVGLLTLTSCTATPAPAPSAPASEGTSVSAEPEVSDAAGQEPPTSPPTTPVPEQSPEETDTTGIAASVESALRALADSQSSVTRDQVHAAIELGFQEAGSAPEGIEVSIDRTPTGLDVDAIQGAGRTGRSCVIGEVRAGAVAVTVLPVLSTGLCFVGDQR